MNADCLVSSAEIARLAGVTRAAVSNWRKRYVDFPEPAMGVGRAVLFPLVDVRSWLERHRKGNEVSEEVQLWQALRASHGDEMVSGIADVAELLAEGKSPVLSSDIRSLLEHLASDSSPAEVVSGLVERFASDHRLARAVRYFAGVSRGMVFDPACGVGSLLLSFADSPDIILAGQEADPEAVRLARARAKLAGHVDVMVKIGDSLRGDQWSGLAADLVVCQPPPAGSTDWGREDLLLDARWEFGIPTRAEAELAWLQHCYAHLAPGGKLVLVVSPSAAYRTAGRRIRAEIVRRGILTQVVGLPPGMVAAHSQPVHLWFLTRSAAPVTAVRMIDLTENDRDGPLDPAPRQVVDVPLIELLDEAVDLTPAHHVAALRKDYVAELRSAREDLVVRLHDLLDLLDLLPSVAEGPGVLGASLRIADLVRAGLIDLADGRPTSVGDQLDTDFLCGFLRSTVNARRSTSASGSFRIDARGARVPQMDIADQRLYGDAFRGLDAFERRVKEFAALSERLIALARDGLTNGSLRPDQTGRNGLGIPLQET
ncbi:N-6 DNA methylase [Sphaerimonospora cavernae]|uniref:N-6 DNA methylase n=1 Tax=Sphaerimonospora cavernae TaxID=1740611 RepID=A0ABV6UBF3_9ACTN